MLKKFIYISALTMFLLAACDDGGKKTGPDTIPPGFPTGFSVEPNGDSLELTWTMPGDADLEGVLVLRQADLGPEGEPVTGTAYAAGDVIGSADVLHSGASTLASYIDTPPAPGTWCYRVFVFDGSFNYAGSASRCVDTSAADTNPPVFAGLISATGLSNTQIELSWGAASDDVTSAENLVYDVYQAAAAGEINYASPTYTSSAGASGFTVFGLTPGTTYWFAVRARDAAGNRDANTETRSASTQQGADTTPPVFSGLVVASAVSATQIDLFWGAANDDTTAAADLVYDVFQSTVSGGQTFGAPSYSTAPGATTLQVTGLTPQTTYHFVVRARDAAGNSDDNTQERSATTTAATDTTAPVFAGLTAASPASDTQILLTWGDATDDETLSEDIVYHVYRSTVSGSYNFSAPTLVTSPGQTSATIGSLTASSTHYFIVRAKDLAGNIDTNTIERSATTLSGPDTTAPNFTGVISATAQSSSTILLAWNAAVDNVTPAGSIVYDIYHATNPGAQNFAVPNFSTSPGASGYTVTGLSPSTTYYFVVRARDGAGNRDVNLIERSATTAVADVTPPFISTDNFSTGSALVSGTTGFVASVTFSEIVSGINATNITIDHGATLSGFSTSDSITWNFTASGLTDGTRYTVSFGAGIRDGSSNALAPTSREIYVAADVLYVRPGGAGVQDGSSPANALPLVSQALSIAAAGTDIYVQGGTYSDSITVKEGVNIYGGYDPSFTVRDTVNNQSLLTQSAFDATVTATGTGITRNTVIDGMAFTNNYGNTRAVLRISAGAGLTVRNSRLYLGNAGCYNQYVILANSGTGNQLTIENSSLDAGGMAANYYCSRYVYGINFSSADGQLRLDGNTIHTGACLETSSSYTYAFYGMVANGHTVEIVNNVIDANGTGTPTSRYTYGIYHTANTAYRKLVIANNTISGGTGYYRYGLYLSGSINAQHDVRIGNNVLFTSAPGSYAYAIYRDSTTGKLSRIENNMFTAIGYHLYSGAYYSTLSSMETYLTGVGTVASFNKEVATIADLYFANYTGRDWQPTASSPLSLTQGGRDTSGIDWGSVVEDRLGTPRTVLYSIGAYEMN
ncbi:fibronectin type III domain-containing protein [Myxococcota bacterium]|nr:fibronectin type III domain-containing protein [Myxococcota bacterium]